MIEMGKLMRSIFVLLTVFLLGTAPALAQDADLQPLLDRLQRLEKDIKVLSRSVFKGEQPPAAAAVGDVGGASAARMGVRITELEEQLRAMTGSLETVSFKIDQVTRRLDQVMADIEFRLGSLEGGKPAGGAPRVAIVPKAASVTAAPVEGGTAPQPGTLGSISEKDLAAVQGSASQTSEETKPAEAKVSSQPLKQQPSAQQASVEPTKPATPREQYNQARKLLITGDFDRAEAALKTFLADHPKDPLAANARYWLGETYYVRGDFLQAAETFLTNYQSDPKGAKAPDGLLKLGMALANLEKKREACATFGKLLKEYPNAATNVKKVAERERKRNGC